MKPKTRYVVEWCESVPKDENGESILEQAKYIEEPFGTMMAAQKRAGELIAARKDFFGCIRIAEQELIERRGVAKWEVLGDPHHVSSDDGSLDD